MSDALDRARQLVLRPLPGQVAPPVKDSQAAQALAMISMAEEIRAVREFLEASARPVVVKVDGDLTPEQAERIRAAMRSGTSIGGR